MLLFDVNCTFTVIFTTPAQSDSGVRDISENSALILFIRSSLKVKKKKNSTSHKSPQRRDEIDN